MAKLTPAAYRAKYNQIFADNEFQNIVEGSFRELARDTADSFAVTGPNFRPDLIKQVGVKRHSDFSRARGYMSMEDLEPLLMCLGTRIFVELPPAGESGEYVVVYDETSTMNVWREATFRGETVPASIVPVESPQAIGASVPEFDPFDPLGYDGPDANGRGAAVVRRTVNFVVLFYSALQNIAPDDFPGGFPVPGTPGGAAYWREASPPNPVYRAFEQIKHAVLLFQADDSDYISAGRIYAITDRPNGVETVYAEFDTTESRVCEKARVAGLTGLFRYDLTTDTLTPLESGITEQQAVEAVRNSGEFATETYVDDQLLPLRGTVAELVKPNGRRWPFTSLPDALAEFTAGDIVRVLVPLVYDTTSARFDFPAVGTLEIVAGAALVCFVVALPNEVGGTFRIAGGGTLNAVVLASPQAADLVMTVREHNGRINRYDFGADEPTPWRVRVVGVRGISTTDYFYAGYAYGGFRKRYVQATFEHCDIEAAGNIFTYVDSFSGTAANDAVARAGNKLTLLGNVLRAPANKRVLDDTEGALGLELAGNTYIGVSKPAQAYAVLLASDGVGTAGPAPGGSSTILVFDTTDGLRVSRGIPVLEKFQIGVEILDTNASGITYQLDTNTRTSRVFGPPDQTRAQINAQLAALTPPQISEGSKLYAKCLPAVLANASTVYIPLNA